ncbi:MAG: hypothetical protein PHH82_03835 [Candidatus ainarchaeum sp.]|nr:hypothetical protein [Candidatus ainarchaeum sp.]
MPKKIRRQKPKEERKPKQHELTLKTPQERHMHLVQLATQSEKVILETQRLHPKLDAATRIIEQRVRSRLPVSKDHALGWLKQKKEFLQNSIKYWLIEHEIVETGFHTEEEKVQLKSHIESAIQRRQQYLKLVESAKQRINKGENPNIVLFDMQAELDSSRN